MHGQTRTANELKIKGVIVSPGGIRSIWLRHGLERRSLRLNRRTGEGQRREGSPRRDRDPSSGLFVWTGYILRGLYQRHRQDIPADRY
jgi:hypothetical protein